MPFKEELREYLLSNRDKTFSIKGLEEMFGKQTDLIIKTLGVIEREEGTKITYF